MCATAANLVEHVLHFARAITIFTGPPFRQPIWKLSSKPIRSAFPSSSGSSISCRSSTIGALFRSRRPFGLGRACGGGAGGGTGTGVGVSPFTSASRPRRRASSSSSLDASTAARRCRGHLDAIEEILERPLRDLHRHHALPRRLRYAKRALVQALVEDAEVAPVEEQDLQRVSPSPEEQEQRAAPRLAPESIGHEPAEPLEAPSQVDGV
jgi:hypothetical protein